MAYFANGTEGMVLDEQCADCLHGDDPDSDNLVCCPIYYVQSMWNYDQLKDINRNVRKVLNSLINEKGVCQMKLIMDKYQKAQQHDRYVEYIDRLVEEDRKKVKEGQ